MSSEQKIEQILVDLGLTGPRITPGMIDELMREVTYSTHVVPGTTTTVATAIDGAGFTLCSVSSACASPENFNPALGIEIAITKARGAAREKLWELEGYRLSRALRDARSNTSTKALEQIRAVLAKPGAVTETLPGPAVAPPRVLLGTACQGETITLGRAVELSETLTPSEQGLADHLEGVLREILVPAGGQDEPTPLAVQLKAAAADLGATAGHVRAGLARARGELVECGCGRKGCAKL